MTFSGGHPITDKEFKVILQNKYLYDIDNIRVRINAHYTRKKIKELKKGYNRFKTE